MKKNNIVLIGFMGCGKSTVGKKLANAFSYEFADTDAMIEEAYGKTISKMFEEDGEECFRNAETELLRKLSKEAEGLILATGGGCVTQARNYPLLHQNGTIFCLQRALDKLPTDGRPLSQSNKLEDMYRIRKPLYEAFADHIIGNNGSCEETIASILSKLEEMQ